MSTLTTFSGAAFLGVAALTFGSCSDSCDCPPVTPPPVITSMAVPSDIEINQTVELDVVANDPSALALIYHWSCPVGSFANADQRTTQWTAPATGMSDVVIRVQVVNAASALATDTRTTVVIDPVTNDVGAIISTKCATCHMALPTSHTGALDIDQCGACHVPYGNTTAFDHNAATTGCSGCHQTPADTHFFLRDDADQWVHKANVDPECIACHRDGGFQTHGRGRPALDSSVAILASARQGTLRSWIQPGGFMAKYLDAAEVTTLTTWVDSLSTDRTLGYDPYLDASPTSDFTINGLGDNAAWDAATEHVVQVEPTMFTSTSTVAMKALYSGDYLYIRVQYDESTLSMTRSGSWILDGMAWRHPTANSDNDKQSEDRVAFLWDISTPNFRDRYGCALKCHGNYPGSACFTDLEGARADIWHTKAARAMAVTSHTDSGNLTIDYLTEAFEVRAGSAAFTGWSDDKWLTSYMNLGDGYDTEDSGRRGDAGTSMYSHNRNGTKTAPLYMQTLPTSWTDAMVLTQTEVDAGLLSGSVIVADPGDPAYNAALVATAFDQYIALHAVVPERILRVPAGSRADLLFGASWDNGTWVNEFRQPLQSGNDDDVQFETSGATEYSFGVAIFDNCGRGEIPPGHTTYGDGQFQILRFVR